jgi:hypothetical protein
MNFDGEEESNALVPSSIIGSACQKPDREGGPYSEVPMMNRLTANILSEADS